MDEQSRQIIVEDIRGDPGIKHLLERMPSSIGKSLDDEQLKYIRNAISVRKRRKHGIDWHGIFTIPLVGWQYYCVLHIGKNPRHRSRKEKRISALFVAIIISGVVSLAILFALLILYLLKSAWGIDLFSGSLGIWAWFKANLLQF